MEAKSTKTAEEPEVTIIIGTLNRPHVALSLINQIVMNTGGISVEIILIDQSTEENFKTLESSLQNIPNAKLIHFRTANTPKYLNYGWKNAQAPIVLYLDDDTSITPETIKKHLQAFNNSDIHGVAGRVINDGERVTNNAPIGKITWYGAQFDANFSAQHEDFVDYPYGCNMSFRKNSLRELEGFDEKLMSPIYAYNEVDLGSRLNKKWPKGLIFQPRALVYHHRYQKGGTRNNFSPSEVYSSTQWNYGYYLGKNYSFFENFLCLSRRVIFQLTNEPGAIPHIIRGLVAGKKCASVEDKDTK